MVRAILKNGVIQPIDPIPPVWEDGITLEVEAPPVGLDPETVERWFQELDEARKHIPAQDHEIMAQTIAEQKRASKKQVRREMGLEG